MQVEISPKTQHRVLFHSVTKNNQNDNFLFFNSPWVTQFLTKMTKICTFSFFCTNYCLKLFNIFNYLLQMSTVVEKNVELLLYLCNTIDTILHAFLLKRLFLFIAFLNSIFGLSTKGQWNFRGFVSVCSYITLFLRNRASVKKIYMWR